MQVISYIGGAVIVITVIIDIILWIYIFYFKIKCYHVKGCQNENCVNRGNCDKTKMTENERKELLALLESLDKIQIEL